MRTTRLIGFFIIALMLISNGCERYTFPDSGLSNYGKLSFSEKKKLKSILKDGKLITELVYDSSDRVVEIKKYCGDTDDASTEKLTYNRDGQLTRRSYWGNLQDHFIYKDGRLTEMYTKNTSNPEYEKRLVYQYKGDRIYRAETFVYGKSSGFIFYEYDDKGNTTVRSEKYKTLEPSSYRFSYDNKVNPFHFPDQSPIDIIQRNNPVKSYVSNMLSSCMSQEITTDYTYDADGYPVTASSYITEKPDVIISSLEYIYEE